MQMNEGNENQLEQLKRENAELGEKYAKSIKYIRDKTDQLLKVMGTSPLKSEELDDSTLIETDPIGIVSNSFTQILRHLNKTNDKLRFARDEIQAIFDSAGMGIVVVNKEMRVLAYNKKLQEMFFRGRDEIIGNHCHNVICNIAILSANCPFKSIFVTGEAVHRDRWKLGERYFNVVGTAIKDASGGPITSIVMVYMDITDLVDAEDALRKSRERYRDLFENANDLIQSVGPDGRMQYVNRAWREALGYSDDEVQNLSMLDVIHPDCVSCGMEINRIIYGDKTGRVETNFITKDGREIIVEGNINAMYEDGVFLGTRGIFRDITERKRVKEALIAEREQLLITLRSIGDGVITTDTTGTVVLMNKVSEILTGWTQEAAAGRPMSEVFRIIDEKTRASLSDPVKSVLSTGNVYELPRHAMLIARDGTERLIADSIAPIRDRQSEIIGAVLVFRDITEKQRMEERLLKSEKIESLGVLAGGIAHDFNNLLNVIIGSMDLISSNIEPGSIEEEICQRAERAALSAMDLTNQLLTFSKGGAPLKKPGRLGDLVRDSAEFILRGSKVRATYALPEDLWHAEFDQGQMSQVVNNLVLNAMQAMPEGGDLFISAGNVTFGMDDPGRQAGEKAVKISIRDTGVGMTPEVAGRIFEPYFTTKEMGNGLGLATSYSIMKNHGGGIEVVSSPGAGATFNLWLPAFFGTDTSGVPKIEKAVSKGSGGRVLLMDDEELVRMTATAMISRVGYEATSVADGEAAIAEYRKALSEGEPYVAVIMDLTIPGGMGGKDAITHMLELDPKVKCIVSSGYSSDPVMANYRKYGFSAVLAKPYRIKDIENVLHEIIG